MEVRTFYDEGSRFVSIRRHGSIPDRDSLGLPENVVEWVNFYWQKVQLENMRAEAAQLQDEIQQIEAATEYLPFPQCFFPSIQKNNAD